MISWHVQASSLWQQWYQPPWHGWNKVAHIALFCVDPRSPSVWGNQSSPARRWSFSLHYMHPMALLVLVPGLLLPYRKRMYNVAAKILEIQRHLWSNNKKKSSVAGESGQLWDMSDTVETVEEYRFSYTEETEQIRSASSQSNTHTHNSVRVASSHSSARVPSSSGSLQRDGSTRCETSSSEIQPDTQGLMEYESHSYVDGNGVVHYRSKQFLAVPAVQMPYATRLEPQGNRAQSWNSGGALRPQSFQHPRYKAFRLCNNSMLLGLLSCCWP